MNMNIVRLWMVLAISLFLGADRPRVEKAAAAPEIDALFARENGWIGGDGVYSVPMGSRRILWLFSDTWVGKIREGKRTDATIVNNTIGVQGGSLEKLTFHIARDGEKKPTALIVPTDGRGWYWLLAAFANKDRLHLFLNQVEKGKNDDALGFRPIGMALATVANPNERPETWRITQIKLPNTIYSTERILTWGTATLQVGDMLYVYGIDERPGQPLPDRQMIVARVPIDSVNDFARWRYFHDRQWVEQFQNVRPQAGNMAWEYSVTPLGSRYLMVCTELGLSPRILGRLADNPWGPWSESVVLYECPEMKPGKKLFTYAAKAHPSLSKDRDIVVSYVVNSFDFWQVARDASLYWPRFVRIKMKNAE